jgi:LysR family cys regulon transcriptional activator
MNFQQLRSVREAVRRQFNLTAVAEALHTSQPGVSRQIRELEEELGMDIFVRAGKRLTGLTPPGEALMPVNACCKRPTTSSAWATIWRPKTAAT